MVLIFIISPFLSVAEGRAGQNVEGRTFGKIRRLQMALIPIIFKFGVLTAMVAFLVAIGMKTLFLVKVLLAINALAILGKFFTLKSNFGHMPYPAHSSWNPHAHIEYVAPQPSWGWGPPPTSSGWSAAPVAAAPEYKHLEHEHHAASSNSAQPTKEIHLHIHGGQAAPKVEAYSYSTPSNGWQRSDPYVAYDPSSTLSTQNDLTVDATKSIPFQVDTNVPSNHRMF